MNRNHFTQPRPRIVFVPHGEFADLTPDKQRDALYQSLSLYLSHEICASFRRPNELMLEFGDRVLFLLFSETFSLIQVVTPRGHLAVLMSPPFEL
jgi:hypothetical protein